MIVHFLVMIKDSSCCESNVQSAVAWWRRYSRIEMCLDLTVFEGLVSCDVL